MERPVIKQITAENLTFSYDGRPAAGFPVGGKASEKFQLAGDVHGVDKVSFTAKAGELVAIVGPNGCGKSTLLRLLVGELRPASGQWKLDEIVAASLPRIAAARYVSLVPQSVFAPFGYTVREMVLMARHAAHAQNSLIPLGFETPADLQLATEAMWAADVHHLADRPINELSGGERQRVAIARAFTQDTPLMLLDEPTSNLDLFHQLELIEQLRQMTQVESRVALLVTHDLNLAAAHATRVLLMDRGRIIADGPPGEVLTPAILEPIYRVKVEKLPTGLRFSRHAI